MEAPTLSDTVRKVDRAVARLEELQGILLQGRRNQTLQQYNSSRDTAVASRGNGSNSNYCNRDVTERSSRRDAPGTVKEARRWRSGTAGTGETGGEWRRSSTAAAIAEGGVTDVRAAARGNVAGRTSNNLPTGGRPTNRTAPREPLAAPSPPSSAASRFSGGPRGQSMSDALSAGSTSSSRAFVPAPPAPSKPFLVDARRQPNRPWRLSSPAVIAVSPTPSTITTSTASAVSSSTATTSTRRTVPLQQLPRNVSRPSSPNIPNQPAPYRSDGYNKENEEERMMMSPLIIPPAVKTKARIKMKSPSSKPWFTRRFSLPISPSTKSTRAALSLLSRQLPAAGSSPEKPLPSLITRLPTRKKKPFQYTKSPDVGLPAAPKLAAAAPDKAGPLPLPPALREYVGVTSIKNMQDAAAAALDGAKERRGPKPGHQRSLSCPRQRLLQRPFPLEYGILNRQPVDGDRREPGCSISCSCGLASKRIKPPSCELDSCATAAGRAFSGCTSSMIHSLWSAAPLKRSWSFSSHDRNESNLTVAGPDFLEQRHFKGCVQNNKDSNSQVYRADSLTRRACKESQKVYHV